MRTTTILSLLLGLLALLVVGRIAAECPVDLVINGNSTDDATDNGGKCKSLQEALERLSITSVTNVTVESAIIYVHSGYHYLTAPINFSANFVNVTGIGENVFITCNYPTKPEGITGGEYYTWLFQETLSVTIENLEFYQCPYPFRILHTQNVHIIDSSFRSECF